MYKVLTRRPASRARLFAPPTAATKGMRSSPPSQATTQQYGYQRVFTSSYCTCKCHPRLRPYREATRVHFILTQWRRESSLLFHFQPPTSTRLALGALGALVDTRRTPLKPRLDLSSPPCQIKHPVAPIS